MNYKKTIRTVLIILTFLPLCTFAQGGLLGRIKDKVKSKIDSQVDATIDKTLNGTNTNAVSQPDQNSDVSKEVSASPSNNRISSYSKFDFVPGDKVLYAEDFAQDNIGELPLNWNANGKGELVTWIK